MSGAFPYPTLSCFGVEMEYMVVSRSTLRILPIADILLPVTGDSEETDYPFGALHWSNELVRHVIEFKNAQPVAAPESLLSHFAESVNQANRLLAAHDACLMPSGMHPDFRPLEETVLWPYGNHAIYQRFNEIFDCRGHGWSNLQSTHINLAFGSEDEFVRLHAVLRLILPLLPALAASSPIIENRDSGWKSARMHAYSKNCARLPILTGRVIPEAIGSIDEYESKIYAPIREAIAPWNNDDLLDPVWVNARGAIARFDRGSIEIRVLDLQECPSQDIALVNLVLDLTRALYQSALTTAQLLAAPQEPLENLFFATAEQGTRCAFPTELSQYYPHLDSQSSHETVINVVQKILKSEPEAKESSLKFAQLCKDQGNLAERMLHHWQQTPRWQPLARRLCECLADGQILRKFLILHPQ